MNLGSFLDEHHIKTVIGEDVFDAVGMTLDGESGDKNGVVGSEPEKYVFAEWKKEVRRALMAGRHSEDISKMFLANVRTAGIDDEFGNYLRACDGLIGTIIVDCDCLGAKGKLSSKYKPFNRFAMNCKCGYEEVEESLETSQNEGTISSYLSENLERKVISKRRVCKRCGLPVILSSKDILSSDVFSVVDELCKRGFITAKRCAALKQSRNLVSDLRKLFSSGILDYKQRVVSAIASKNDIEDYNVSRGQLSADAIGKVSSISVDAGKESAKIKGVVELSKSSTAEVLDRRPKSIKGKIELFDSSELEGIDVGEQSLEEVNVQNGFGLVDVVDDSEQIDGVLDVDSLGAGDLDIDGSEADIELAVEKRVSNTEVDSRSVVSDEWFENDEIDIAEFDKKAKPVKIGNRYKFDI